MTNSNHNHKTELPCAFAETLVTVLYGEATVAERTAFERHLTGCHSCSEEFFAFGAVRNAVGEWRENAFLPLETPEIVLPATGKPVVVEAEKVTWLDSLRGYLFPSGGFLQGASALAALAVCAVLIAVFGYNLVNKPDTNVGATPSIAVESPSPPPNETRAAPPKDELAVNDDSQDKKPPVSSMKAEPNAPRSKSSPRPAAFEPERKSAPKQKTQPRRPKKEELQLPVDDFEDDSIRLADLFDEISSTD